jgi:cytochrome P450
MTTDTLTSPALAPSTPPVRRLADLPGPRGLPVLGNALQIKPASMHLQLEAWSRLYGPAFKVRIAKRTWLVVADHEAVSSSLRDRPDRFRRPSLGGRIAREMGFDEGLFFANDEVWKRQRRMVMAGFAPGHVKAYFPSLQKVTQRLQGRWFHAAQSGATIDLQADLMRFTVDVIAGLAFGAEVNTLESDDDVIQRHLNKIFPALWNRVLAVWPRWRYVRLPADRALDRSVIEVNAAIRGFIAKARERLRLEPARREQPRNLLEAMITAADESGSGLNDADVAGNVFIMLLAGEDTTANTLAWMIYLLHQNPQAMARARDEVRRVAPDAAQFTPEQIGELEFIEACAHETMRLKPVAPLLAVQAVQATTLAGVEIPADTVVFTLMRHASVSETQFPDPLAFRPERWINGEMPAQSASSAKRVSMPFGAGPRVCPGRYLALFEMKMALAMLLGSFDIDSVDAPDGGEVREHLAFAMGPAGLRMRLRRRIA